MELSAEMIVKLEKLATRKIWSDNPDFMIDDYAGGQTDDAFYGGSDAGETLLAREILGLQFPQ